MASYRQQDVRNPHFQLPFRFGGINGGAFVNEQDSTDDIIDCIKAIIAFPIGSRQDLPTFGVPDLLFKRVDDQVISQVQLAIARWEVRAAITVDGEQVITDELIQRLIMKVGTTDG